MLIIFVPAENNKGFCEKKWLKESTNMCLLMKKVVEKIPLGVVEKVVAPQQ